MRALTGEELVAWLESTSTHWRSLVTEHPEVLAMPCDVRESQTAGDLLEHIAVVELWYAQRLRGDAELVFPKAEERSVQAIYALHATAIEILQEMLKRPESFWGETIELPTRSAGVLLVARRAVLVHLAMHAIRHYAQLATLVRQHGVKPGWAMDYLFLEGVTTPAA
jgi:uncharacterized damage-inducible protein DinB